MINIKRKGEWFAKPRIFSIKMIISTKGAKLVLDGQKTKTKERQQNRYYNGFWIPKDHDM